MLRHVVPLHDGNCRLTRDAVKGRAARDSLPNIFDISMFKSGKKNSTTIKHIYNET